MFKKILAFFLAAVIMAAGLSVTAYAESASLSDVYWDNTTNKVFFTLTFSGVGNDAQIMIVPAGTPKDEVKADNVDIAYKWLKDMKSGVRDSIGASLKPGAKYELHVYADNNGGACLCSKSFTAVEGTASLSDISWDGETRTVSFKLKFDNVGRDAQILLVPAGTPRKEIEADNADIAYKWLRDMQSGKKDSIKYNLKPGKYELQVYADNNGGSCLCWESFTVASPSGSLSNVYWKKSNETLYFTLTYRDLCDSDGWIAIVPSGTPRNEVKADEVDIAYKWLSDIKSGKQDTITVKGLKPGTYELHAYSNNNGGDCIAWVKFNTEDSTPVSSGDSGSSSGGSSDGSSSGGSSGASSSSGSSSASGAAIVLILGEGDKVYLDAEGLEGKITWSSSNKSVAKVNSKGMVTAKSEGTAVITAKGSNGSVKIKIIVE